MGEHAGSDATKVPGCGPQNEASGLTLDLRRFQGFGRHSAPSLGRRRSRCRRFSQHVVWTAGDMRGGLTCMDEVEAGAGHAQATTADYDLLGTHASDLGPTTTLKSGA